MTSATPLMPLSIRPGQSRQVAAFAMLVHLTGSIALTLTPMPTAFQLFLSAALIGSLVYTLLTHCWRIAPWAISEVRKAPEVEGDWILDLQSGREIASAKLLPTSFVGQRVVILNFRTGSFLAFRTLVLASDNATPDILRRLRASLHNR